MRLVIPRSVTALVAPRPPDPLAYSAMLELYDRRTRAAYEVMGRRWQQFVAAKDVFLAAEPNTTAWYEAGERAYRLGLRSTHAYYLWTRGHTAVALDPAAVDAAPGRIDTLRLRLGEKLQSLRR